jgi:hypothetical protein
VKAPSTADDDAVLGKNPQPTPMKQFVHTLRDNWERNLGFHFSTRSLAPAPLAE